MKKLLISLLAVFTLFGISKICFAQDNQITKSLNIAILTGYSFLSKTNQNGTKSVAKGYTIGADASMMLFQMAQGWGMGPFASYTFTQAKNSSSASEKWSARNFQAGIRMIFSSLHFEAGYSTSTLFFTKDPTTIMGATQGFVAGAGYTLMGQEFIFRLLVKYAFETIQNNSQISYSSSYNVLMFGAQIGYSF